MASISPDTPLRLRDAIKEAFPAGGVTVAALRREIARGRLEAELIAGKHFVTLAAIGRMRELCRIAPTPQQGDDRLRNRTTDQQPSGLTSQEILRTRLRMLREARKGPKKKEQPVP